MGITTGISTIQRMAGGVGYELTRRRVKNINLHIRRDGTAAVSASPRVAVREVDAFVAAHAKWITAAQRRVLAQGEAEAASALPEPAEALRLFQTLCARYWPEFAPLCPCGMPKIKVRDMRTRWGTCNLKTNTLTFSVRLAAMPYAAQEYVVVHEYSHFAQANHSPAFWAVVARHMPDWRARRALLRLPKE
jgi:predicted metal-dependent hydrolase